jgi:hypothetical protein
VTGFSVDPNALARQAAGYDTVAGMLAAVQQRLSAAMAAYHGCWGDDEAGSLFGVKYQPNETNTVEQMGKGVTAVQNMAGVIHSWAQSYPDTDATLT